MKEMRTYIIVFLPYKINILKILSNAVKHNSNANYIII